MVGMKGAKNIIAINKDKEAPIFSIADLGIVGDVHKVLPKLIEALQARADRVARPSVPARANLRRCQADPGRHLAELGRQPGGAAGRARASGHRGRAGRHREAGRGRGPDGEGGRLGPQLHRHRPHRRPARGARPLRGRSCRRHRALPGDRPGRHHARGPQRRARPARAWPCPTSATSPTRPWPARRRRRPTAPARTCPAWPARSSGCGSSPATARSWRARADEEPRSSTAARVGLGALGIVSTVTLQVVPAFNLPCVERADARRRRAAPTSTPSSTATTTSSSSGCRTPAGR